MHFYSTLYHHRLYHHIYNYNNQPNTKRSSCLVFAVSYLNDTLSVLPCFTFTTFVTYYNNNHHHQHHYHRPSDSACATRLYHQKGKCIFTFSFDQSLKCRKGFHRSRFLERVRERERCFNATFSLLFVYNANNQEGPVTFLSLPFFCPHKCTSQAQATHGKVGWLSFFLYFFICIYFFSTSLLLSLSPSSSSCVLCSKILMLLLLLLLVQSVSVTKRRIFLQVLYDGCRH